MSAMIAHQMNETILGCNRCGGWERDCYQNFRMVFTGLGICYTWNALSPVIIHNYQLRLFRLLCDSRRANFSKPSTWSLENGYVDNLDGGYPYNAIGGQSGHFMTFAFNIPANNTESGCDNDGFEVESFSHQYFPYNNISTHEIDRHI